METLELKNFNDPNKVLVLSYDTEIVVSGEVHLRAIHMDVGCNSIKLSGDGKLCLHPKNMDHVAIGILPLNVVKHLIWRVNERPFAMEVSCRELSILSSDYVQWFGVYGQFPEGQVTVAEDTQMPENWEKRKSYLFTVGSQNYFGAFMEYSTEWNALEMRRLKRLRDTLQEIKLKGQSCWTFLVMSYDDIRIRFLSMLTEQILSSSGGTGECLYSANRIIVIFALSYKAFFDCPLSQRFIYDCISICQAFDKRYFAMPGNVSLQTFFTDYVLTAIESDDMTKFNLSGAEALKLCREYYTNDVLSKRAAKHAEEVMHGLREIPKPKYALYLEELIGRVANSGIRGV